MSSGVTGRRDSPPSFLLPLSLVPWVREGRSRPPGEEERKQRGLRGAKLLGDGISRPALPAPPGNLGLSFLVCKVEIVSPISGMSGHSCI